jgi:MoaA/NifB/PqqE/SkfB family radical SAM enzyme
VSFQFVFILPTTACPDPCAGCFYETGHTRRVPSVDFLEPLDRALDLLADDGLQQLVVTGGEPLLSPRLEPLLELCAGKLVHLALLTRGDLLDEGRLQRLEQLGVDDITLNARAADPELRRLAQRILFHSRYVPTLLTCITRRNLGEIGALDELSQQLNLPHIFTPAYIPEAARDFEALSLHGLDEPGWDKLLEDLAGWADRHHSRGYLEFVRSFYAGLEVRPGSCPMGSSGFVVDADAAVYPCFHRHDLRAGNLLDDPWPRIEGRLLAAADELTSATCFGEHCLSLFVGIRRGGGAGSE